MISGRFFGVGAGWVAGWVEALQAAAKHYPPADILDRSFEVRRTEGVGSSGSTPSLLIGPKSGRTKAYESTADTGEERSDE
jgi:uncharacterized protein (DUF2342 family)